MSRKPSGPASNHALSIKEDITPILQTSYTTHGKSAVSIATFGQSCWCHIAKKTRVVHNRLWENEAFLWEHIDQPSLKGWVSVARKYGGCSLPLKLKLSHWLLGIEYANITCCVLEISFGRSQCRLWAMRNSKVKFNGEKKSGRIGLQSRHR